ncbi:MAG TPA: DEAD/DEAH box helicase [Phycisphaerae bacterium]|nr:DEAD/DEAH box helicase [Phycisphaerae bacterium]HNU45400.1 DEAD/DEAH box helicase [Phycisphaerae bacterium]
MDRGEVCSRFIDGLPYALYPFQEEALLAWFESEGGVLVAAPTGMGKTLIAEAAIFEALHGGQRLYYTTPLIALTDQKFREFREKAAGWGFNPDEVGLITGNRRVNPDARVRVVVAEILLNHLLADEPTLGEVSSVVMDEFHNFNDFERGIVWELSLVLLPRHIRLMLLSATVGNTVEFLGWLREQHGRSLRLVQSSERRVPLEYIWVGDKLMTEHLSAMVRDDDAANRTPALVFCFNRDECWDVAEKLKGLHLIDAKARAQIEQELDPADFKDGVGPKLRQMLIRGVGVHHAGVLPKHKEAVERLFLKKLTPFVICTETLAAGINLPARSVVLNTLLKGKPGERKPIPSSAAHQMFGRAGRPQFDTKGYVYALAHEDDVKIDKWRRKFDQLPATSKDPGILRARKELERKRPTRRKTEQYWSEGQFKQLIEAGPAKLYSRSMIPYQVLVYLLTKTGTLHQVREFLGRRFNTADRLEKFQKQLDAMIDNLAVFGYLDKAADGEHVTIKETIHELLGFRSIDPLYAAFLSKFIARSTLPEKIQALEAVLPLPPAIERKVRGYDLPVGPFEEHELNPLLVQMGLIGSGGRPVRERDEEGAHTYERADWYEDEDAENEHPLSLPEKLQMVFEAKLSVPEFIFSQPKWVAGGVFECNDEFYKYVGSHDLTKNEGLILRHLLRLVILAGEFQLATQDPEYQELAERVTKVCQSVDPRYTDKFLADEAARQGLEMSG